VPVQLSADGEEEVARGALAAGTQLLVVLSGLKGVEAGEVRPRGGPGSGPAGKGAAAPLRRRRLCAACDEPNAAPHPGL
jgi:hypothetical protein